MNTVLHIPELCVGICGNISVNELDALRVTCKTMKRELDIYYMRRALCALRADNAPRFSLVTSHTHVHEKKKEYERKPTCLHITKKGIPCLRDSNENYKKRNTEDGSWSVSMYCGMHSRHHGYF